MTDKPIGPKPIPQDAIPHDLRIMRAAARAMLAEVKRLADELPPFVALAPADIVRATVKFIDADGLALRLFESGDYE